MSKTIRLIIGLFAFGTGIAVATGPHYSGLIGMVVLSIGAIQTGITLNDYFTELMPPKE